MGDPKRPAENHDVAYWLGKRMEHVVGYSQRVDGDCDDITDLMIQVTLTGPEDEIIAEIPTGAITVEDADKAKVPHAIADRMILAWNNWESLERYRDALARDLVEARQEIDDLRAQGGDQTYMGKSAVHWYGKATDHGDMVHAVNPILGAREGEATRGAAARVVADLKGAELEISNLKEAGRALTPGLADDPETDLPPAIGGGLRTAAEATLRDLDDCVETGTPIEGTGAQYLARELRDALADHPAWPVLECPDCEGTGGEGIHPISGKKISCDTCGGNEDSLGRGWIEIVRDPPEPEPASPSLKDLIGAFADLWREFYVGDGKVVAVPALVPHLRTIGLLIGKLKHPPKAIPDVACPMCGKRSIWEVPADAYRCQGCRTCFGREVVPAPKGEHQGASPLAGLADEPTDPDLSPVVCDRMTWCIRGDGHAGTCWRQIDGPMPEAAEKAAAGREGEAVVRAAEDYLEARNFGPSMLPSLSDPIAAYRQRFPREPDEKCDGTGSIETCGPAPDEEHGYPCPDCTTDSTEATTDDLRRVMVMMEILRAVSVLAEQKVREHGEFNSIHEAAAVIKEEYDELWDIVRQKRADRSPAQVRHECVDLAAAAVKCALTFGTVAVFEKMGIEVPGYPGDPDDMVSVELERQPWTCRWCPDEEFATLKDLARHTLHGPHKREPDPKQPAHSDAALCPTCGTYSPWVDADPSIGSVAGYGCERCDVTFTLGADAGPEPDQVDAKVCEQNQWCIRKEGHTKGCWPNVDPSHLGDSPSVEDVAENYLDGLHAGAEPEIGSLLKLLSIDQQAAGRQRMELVRVLYNAGSHPSTTSLGICSVCGRPLDARHGEGCMVAPLDPAKDPAELFTLGDKEPERLGETLALQKPIYCSTVCRAWHQPPDCDGGKQ